MKRTLKFLLVAVLLLASLLLLTGCGNKIVATKETDDEEKGTIKEKIVYKFKDDEIDSIKATYTFEDKETAEEAKEEFDEMVDFISEFSDEKFDMNVEQKGKKVVMELDAESFEALQGESLDTSKEELKENLEKQDYKVR